MSAAPVLVEEHAEGFQESLTERMRRGPLAVTEALRYATQIATCLRDMHMQGLVYGAVSSQLIVLGPGGAALRSRNGLAQLGDPHHDVAAFGALLGEMLRKIEGQAGIQIDIGRLAIRCDREALDMQRVLITLRLIGLQARQGSAQTRKQAPAIHTKTAAGPQLRGKVLHLVYVARHWRPLANLAAFAMSGK